MKKKFDVKGMTCAACQAHVEKAVNKLDGIEVCNVSLLTNSMEVTFDENKVTVDKIEEAVKKEGYYILNLLVNFKNYKVEYGDTKEITVR